MMADHPTAKGEAPRPTDQELDARSEVSDADIQAARFAWHDAAPLPHKGLVDAEVEHPETPE